MFYDRNEQTRRRKTSYRACSGQQTTLDSTYGITAGDLVYLRENGHVHKGFIVDDDALWQLDDDGNWPEAS